MKKKKIRLTSTYRTVLVLLILTLAVIVTLNFLLVKRTETERVEAEGQVRLSSITNRVDSSLYKSECLLDSVAMQVEQIIAEGGNTPELLPTYFSPETIKDISSKSDGSCFSAYAAYNDTLFINGFVPDESFILDERSWYTGALTRLGAIHVTEPYIDASTGEMCYSMSKLLSDGSTVVGLDFNFSSIQSFIEEMGAGESESSLIINESGMIIGHSDSVYVGKNCDDISFYKEFTDKVFMLYGTSFEHTSDGVKYNIFSDKTNYNWYLIVCVDSADSNAGFSSKSIYIIIIMLIFSAAIVIFYIYTCKSKLAAENALSVKDEFLESMSYELKRPLSKIISRADVLMDSGHSLTGSEIGDSAKELNQMLDNLISMSAINNFHKENNDKKKSRNNTVNHRLQIILISTVLFVSSGFALILNTNTQVEWGNTKMQKEMDSYIYQVQEWITGNRTVLDVISDSIAAQPDFPYDYDAAIAYLDSVIADYDDISVAYLCNPEWEHTVLMNNGWEPDENWHVEERQWYIDTLDSKSNFNISAPYLDEQTGLYCTTLSKVVYDADGNFIGLLGIDYYLDKLVGILDESYTDTGYAFLTDINGNILNHPFDEYQMKPESTVNATSVCYRDALTNIRPVIIEDYNEKKMVCYATTEKISGFKVIVTRSIKEIYGSAITSDIIYICVFALCIIIVNVIMRRLTLWQAKVNRELKEAAENAINAGKAKNNFLANMSHEIRTPINAVLGMNEMIMRESGEENIVGYAANIQSAGRTLLSIINDILDFSKIESGKMEIIPVEYDVSSMINDIVNMIKARADKKNLKFIAEIDKNIPSVLYGDDVRLRQIITNILTNAVKYTPAGHVRLRMKILRIYDGKIKLEVSVSDTGIGIREEDINKLFMSFQRLDQEKNRNIEGTGLGITIVQRLLNMMDSGLEVSSVYGVGSTFSFVIEQKIINPDPVGDYELRMKTALEQSKKDSVHTAPDSIVLVVDDNETNLLVAKSLLKRTLVKIDTASSGFECIQKLKTNMYDIVFLDHMMPEMDGIETLQRIKEKQLAVNTTFIALTANAIHGAKQTYIDAGFDDYLSKPFTGHDIEKCLFSHLKKNLVQVTETENTSYKALDADSGFDITKGLKKSGNDKNAYLNIVYDFCDNNRCNDLEFDFSVKDFRSYLLNVKTAAAAADSVGLTGLQQKAEEMCKALEQGDNNFVAVNHKAFMKMYRNAADNLEDAVSGYFSADK